jgi:hypothetical protein
MRPLSNAAQAVRATSANAVRAWSYSKSARAMLEALLAGVPDAEQLAELAKARMRAKIPQLRKALASRFQVDHHGSGEISVMSPILDGGRIREIAVHSQSRECLRVKRSRTGGAWTSGARETLAR